MPDQQHVGIDAVELRRPAIGIGQQIAVMRIRRRRMHELEARASALDLYGQRQVAQIKLLLVAEFRGGVAARRLGHGAEGGRPVAVIVEADGMVVIALDRDVGALAEDFQDLARLRAEIDLIAQHPEFVEILGEHLALEKHLKSVEIAVDVGDDRDLHE